MPLPRKHPARPMLETVLSFIEKVVSALKSVATFFYIRRSTKIESERDALATKSDIQKEQLEIASRPLSAADDVRQRMRDGQL